MNENQNVINAFTNIQNLVSLTPKEYNNIDKRSIYDTNYSCQ